MTLNFKFDDNIHWQPAPDITVQARAFSFFLQCLHAPEEFDKFTTRRHRIFTPDDFKKPFLTPGELEQVNEFKSLKKQIEWMAGRQLVKEMVCRISRGTTDPRDITISYREQGAPFLSRFPHIFISISHAGTYAAAALTRTPGTILGLDLERIRSMPEPGFMRIAFTPAEIKELGEDPREVFRSWTLKEAYLKYIQKGFNENLHHVEILNHAIRHRGRESGVEIFMSTIGREYWLSLVRGRADQVSM